MKMILLDNLNPMTYPIALVFKRLGFEVRYFRIDARLRKSGRADQAGFKGLSFEEIPNGQSKVFKGEARAADILSGTMKKSVAFRKLVDAYALDETGVRKFESLHFRKLLEANGDHIILLVYFGHFSEIAPATKIFLWSTRNRFTDLLNETFIERRRVKNLNFRFFDSVQWLVGRISSKWARSAPHAVTNDPVAVRHSSVKFAPAEVEVCYFPHKGIYYGDFYIKNQFYGEGMFQPSAILHFSLGDSPSAMNRSQAYYVEKGIPFADLFDFKNFSKSEYVLFWLKNGFRFFSASESLFYFSLLKEVEAYRSCLKPFTRLKYALVGYDMLFDSSLSFALHLAGVRTIANQERFLGPWFARHLPIIDHYFVLGEAAKEKLESYPFFTGEVIPVGPVRSDDVKNAILKADHGKYAAFKKQGRKILLALDYHSSSDAEENRFALANHWKNNRRFYQDLIEIAAKFSDLEIVIKGKDFAFLSNPVFSDIVAKMKALPNISVEQDYAAYTPERMLALSDLCVCLYTSLADEAIAAGIPTIIYDFFGYPSDLCDFEGSSVIVGTSEKLLEAVDGFRKTGVVITRQEADRLRSRFYSESTGSVKEKFQRHLQAIVHNS